MRLTYDKSGDAAYVHVTRRPVGGTQVLDEDRIIDLDDEGEVRGIEFLNVSFGVKLDGLPFTDELSALFKDSGIRELAPPSD
jgi:uncharacterized protein YuzE